MEDGVEEDAVDDVAEGVGIGKALGVFAAPDVAFPKAEFVVGTKREPAHGEFDGGDAGQNGEEDGEGGVKGFGAVVG